MALLNEDLMAKARAAGSAREFLALARENGVELTEEEANTYFNQLNSVSCELSDEELDNVAGGGCHIKEGGEKRVVVTNHCKCFTGRWEYYADESIDPVMLGGLPFPKAGAEDRSSFWSCVAEGCCGKCFYLGFKKGLGYCKIS